MLTFVLIDGCEYFWFSLSRVRAGWFFDNQFKTFLSKINCISNNLSFKDNIIYTPFSYFLSSFFLQRLINLKDYDDRLYVNVDDLAMWATELLYRKGWSNEYCIPMTSSLTFLISFTWTHISWWLATLQNKLFNSEARQIAAFISL